MTAALEGGEWSAARPGRTLPPGKTWYPFYTRLGGPQGRSGRAENLVPTGIRSRTIQPVVRRCTDWATQPTTVQHKPTKCIFSTLIVQFLISMSSTCFEPEGSSSGRRLYIQVWYSSFTYISITSLVDSRQCSILLVPMNAQRTTPYLYIQPSSKRWPLEFEACRRHQKLKIKILI